MYFMLNQPGKVLLFREFRYNRCLLQEYSLDTKESKLSDLACPFNELLMHFEMVMTSDEKYIISFTYHVNRNYGSPPTYSQSKWAG